MTHYTTDKYLVDINDDHTIEEGSADHVNQYYFVYFDNFNSKCILHKSEKKIPSLNNNFSVRKNVLILIFY